MAKYVGTIMYGIPYEKTPGVWDEHKIEKKCYGDIVTNTRRLSGTGVNDNISVSNEISIVADAFAIENFHNIKYLTFMGAKWKADSVKVLHPRLIISLGGIYNEESS